MSTFLGRSGQRPDSGSSALEIRAGVTRRATPAGASSSHGTSPTLGREDVSQYVGKGGAGQFSSQGVLDPVVDALHGWLDAEAHHTVLVRRGPVEGEQWAGLHGLGMQPPDPEVFKYMLSGLSLQRPGHPDEMAAAIAFLASPAASYVTGAVLDAHGGYNA